MQLNKAIANSEDTIIVYLSHKASVKTTAKIVNIKRALLTQIPNLILSVVASYTTIVVFYNINKIAVNDMLKKINNIISNTKNNNEITSNKHIKIPVYYHQSVALDLNDLLLAKNLDIDKFITKHTQKSYLVYAVGFMPNFAYLGNIDKSLCTPRLTNPRKNIAAGSVAIADCQTAIYPEQSPAGWRIIGRTPTDISYNGTITFNIGDKVSFYAIDKAEFIQLGGSL